MHIPPPSTVNYLLEDKTDTGETAQGSLFYTKKADMSCMRKNKIINSNTISH